MPRPLIMTPEQRQFWHSQVAYWTTKQKDAERALDYADRQRRTAMHKLGLTSSPKGPQANE